MPGDLVDRSENGASTAGARLIFLASFALYVLFAQEKNYGDGNFLLGFYHEGARVHPVHILYLPALTALRMVFEPLGMSLFEIARLFSAAGMALGVALCYRGMILLGSSRRQAFLAGVAIALCPAVMFFATVVELHGPFFACAGLCFYLLARFVHNPSAALAIQVGLASGLCYYAHASGIIIAGLVGTMFLGLSGPGEWRDRRRWLQVGIMLVVHLLLIYGGSAVLQALGLAVGVEHADAYVRELEVLGEADWTWGLRTLWEEWVYAFMPLSLLVFSAALSASGRRLLTALLPALLTYLLAALVLVGDHDERGAYLLPLVFPAVLGVLHGRPCWRTGLLWGAILIGGSVGLVRILAHDDGSRSVAEAAEFRELIGERAAFLLTGSEADIETCMIRLPGQPFRHLSRYASLLPEELAAELPGIDRAIDRTLAESTEIYITREAMVYLQSDDPRNRSGRDLLAHLRENYRLDDLPGTLFLGQRLRDR